MKEDDDKKDEDPTGCGALLFATVTNIPLLLLGGLVLSKMWTWFIVPALGVASLNYTRAVGVLLVVDFVRVRGRSAKPLGAWIWSKESWMVVAKLLLLGVILLEAYLWHLAIAS